MARVYIDFEEEDIGTMIWVQYGMRPYPPEPPDEEEVEETATVTVLKGDAA